MTEAASVLPIAWYEASDRGVRRYSLNSEEHPFYRSSGLYLLDDPDAASPSLEKIVDISEGGWPIVRIICSGGGTIIYSVDTPRNSEHEGLWSVQLDGTEHQRIMEAHEEYGVPALIDVNSETDQIMFEYSSLAVQRGDGTVPPALNVTDLTSDTLHPAVPDGDEPWITDRYSIFSPGGGKILYSYIDVRDGVSRAAVRNIGEQQEHVILEEQLSGGIGGTGGTRQPRVYTLSRRGFAGQSNIHVFPARSTS